MPTSFKGKSRGRGGSEEVKLGKGRQVVSQGSRGEGCEVRGLEEGEVVRGGKLCVWREDNSPGRVDIYMSRERWDGR